MAAEVAAGAATICESLGGGFAVIAVSSETPSPSNFEAVADAIVEVAKREGAQVVLLGATRLGRQVAARIAVKTSQGVLSDVRDLRVESSGGAAAMLTGVRPVFAGKFNAKVASVLPCVATIPSGAYAPQGASASSTQPPATVEIAMGPKAPERVKHIETRPKPKNTVDLKSAEVIVSAGRGFKNKEDLVLVENLAEALGGVVGASRPLSSDLGWLGEERHIGLTGIYVRPSLYIAVGISGQLQHVAGIKDSKIIVAINKDKQAPIFQVADYGIVGDLYLVVPALLKAIETQKAS
ncbi:MAG: electron transfer flavoprotein subunit alpha/FixB family protein [Thaumarchaeota archaeon]|nr:electron transfer flavoprotein subunit alpha/FixB family protein [Nitrososphaerota archaeon]